MHHSFNKGILKMVQIGDKQFKKHIGSRKIQCRVKSLGKRIEKDYKGKQPIFLVVLNGAMIFASDLLKNINTETEYYCIKVDSYHGGVKTSGKVEISGTLPDLFNKDIIIIEDIIDTGNTMATLIEYISKKQPSSIEIATLFSKPAMRQEYVYARYVGFVIDPLFIVGYGLDYDQKGRNLKDIYILNETV